MRKPVGGSATFLVRRQVLALTAFGLGARIRTLAAAPSPVGQITWGVHVSLAPAWFDPAEMSGAITSKGRSRLAGARSAALEGGPAAHASSVRRACRNGPALMRDPPIPYRRPTPVHRRLRPRAAEPHIRSPLGRGRHQNSSYSRSSGSEGRDQSLWRHLAARTLSGPPDRDQARISLPHRWLVSLRVARCIRPPSRLLPLAPRHASHSATARSAACARAQQWRSAAPARVPVPTRSRNQRLSALSG